MAKRADNVFEDVPPDAAATIESLSALGYSPQSAVADVVDNSLAAGATEVAVTLHWSGSADSWCAIADDGLGMSEAVLRQAMRIGSTDPLELRGPGDLGRFGFGLKTASFSQCRELTVATRASDKGRVHIRSWDLDHVRHTGKWLLRTSAPPGAAELLRECMPAGRGTVVLWRLLGEALVEAGTTSADTSAQAHFRRRIGDVHAHLGATFQRPLQRRNAPLSITVNSARVVPWDPFLVEEDATQVLPPEVLTLKGSMVTVSPFILPHASKLGAEALERASGPLGWSRQQGFYVYRADRLIQVAGWFDLGLPPAPAYDLARIAIEVPPELDREWSLDVNKMRVDPPNALATDLKRIAQETRRRAKRVYQHRGTPVGQSAANRPIQSVWRQKVNRGQLRFSINQSHPLVAATLEDVASQKGAVKRLLRLIEESIPVPLLPTQPEESPEQLYESSSNSELETMAERVYVAYLARGATRAEAAKQLSHTEPFHLFPDLVTRISEADHG